jgi:hypothetical protein
LGMDLSARDTVATETPARAATSTMLALVGLVAGRDLLRPLTVHSRLTDPARSGRSVTVSCRPGA